MISGMTQAAFITVLEEWNKIKWAFATDGKITFYTQDNDNPTVDIPLQIEVNR